MSSYHNPNRKSYFDGFLAGIFIGAFIAVILYILGTILGLCGTCLSCGSTKVMPGRCAEKIGQMMAWKGESTDNFPISSMLYTIGILAIAGAVIGIFVIKQRNNQLDNEWLTNLIEEERKNQKNYNTEVQQKQSRIDGMEAEWEEQIKGYNDKCKEVHIKINQLYEQAKEYIGEEGE